MLIYPFSLPYQGLIEWRRLISCWLIHWSSFRIPRTDLIQQGLYPLLPQTGSISFDWGIVVTSDPQTCVGSWSEVKVAQLGPLRILKALLASGLPPFFSPDQAHHPNVPSPWHARNQSVAGTIITQGGCCSHQVTRVEVGGFATASGPGLAWLQWQGFWVNKHWSHWTPWAWMRLPRDRAHSIIRQQDWGQNHREHWHLKGKLRRELREVGRIIILLMIPLSFTTTCHVLMTVLSAPQTSSHLILNKTLWSRHYHPHFPEKKTDSEALR